jgi:hypothetical protein
MSITTNGILVDLNISLWTGRKMDRKVSNEIDANKHTRVKAGNYHKSLFAGTDKLEKVQSIAGKIRNWHIRQTLPWSDTGTRLLPMGNFFTYKQELSQMEQEFDAAVQDFITAYPTLISAAAFQIGALFNRDDYPSEDKIKHKFNVRTVFHPVPLADDFRVEAETSLKNELQDQYEKMYREREESTAKELWDRLHEYLTTLVDRLEKKQQATEASANGTKTKAGQFHESHLENGLELCDLLTRLNIMNDPQLEAARKYLESALTGVEVKDIRSSEGVRNEVKARVQDILNRFDW